jgi:hypothetical protein
MRVVFDTTVFCADFQMRGNAFRIFLGGYHRAGIRLCIPDIVRDEAVNKYREECVSLADRAMQLVRDGERLIGARINHGFPTKQTVDSLKSEYSIQLTSLGLRDSCGFLPYPDISHRDLVSRALARRRPFREKGVGYRDALVWLSVLRLLAEDSEPLAFVTANTNDFWDGDGLHPDLRKDLEGSGWTGEHVRLFRTLEDLNHALIVPILQTLDDVREEIESGQGRFSLERWVQNDLRSLLRDEEGMGPLEPGHGSSSLSSVTRVRSIQVDAVRQVSSDQILLAATAEVDAELSLSADWDDYKNYSDVREFFETDEDDRFSWIDAVLPIRATVAFSLILTADSLRVLSSELDWWLTDFVDKVELNPHPMDAVVEYWAQDALTASI